MKKIVVIILLLCFFPFFCISCSAEKALSTYNLELVFDNQTKMIEAKQSVNYVNNSDNAFDKLYFHLYPNAFREGAKSQVISIANKSMVYPNGESYGSIDIKSVKIGDRDAVIEIGGEDENILIVNLFEKIFPDEKVEISMEYDVQLPNIYLHVKF